MKIYITGLASGYEVEHLVRLFYPMAPLTLTPPEAGEDCVWAERKPDGLLALVREHGGQEAVSAPLPGPDGETEAFALASLTYDLLRRWTGIRPPWGKMTGVRPVRLIHDKRAAGWSEAEIDRFFLSRFDCSERKYQMARAIADLQEPILRLGSEPKTYSLYIGIPFCPSRCSYCSFVSCNLDRDRKLVQPYVDCLCKEVEAIRDEADKAGLKLCSIYIGGGTPTSLSAAQLRQLMGTVRDCFDLSAIVEYTVEAGRPDTVTPEKLQAIRAAGVSRISINPQTLQDSVLQTIGRRHTVEQFYNAFDMARRAGCDHINTDLIAGLPGDTVAGFDDTLAGILALAPESITVHTLSMKRASNLVIKHRADYTRQEDAVHMVAHTASQLPAAGYRPYYLYRQSRMVGNQENVGWAKPGHEGLYNVYIMDETHTILGCGAGAVSKLKRPASDYLERIFNYKFPYEYNAGLAEMLKRKERVMTFYEEMAAQKDLGHCGDQ